MIHLNQMLTNMVEQNASDLHLTVGSPPRIRVNGNLIELEHEKTNPESVEIITSDF